VRVCQELDASSGECVRERAAWTTAVCREHPWQGYVQETTLSHQLAKPHMFEMFRTYDNLTYQEIPLTGVSNILHNHERDAREDGEGASGQDTDDTFVSHGTQEQRVRALERLRRENSYGVGEPLEPEDFELLELTRIISYGSNKKLVLRWDMGRLWPIPVSQWNVGERSLHTGEYVQEEILGVDTKLLDDRPLYFPPSLNTREEPETTETAE